MSEVTVTLLRLQPAANRGLPNLYPDAAAKGGKPQKRCKKAWPGSRHCTRANISRVQGPPTSYKVGSRQNRLLPQYWAQKGVGWGGGHIAPHGCLPSREQARKGGSRQGFISPVVAPRECVEPQQRSRRLGHKQRGGTL